MTSQTYKVAMLGWFKPAPYVEEQIFGNKVDVIGPDHETHKYDIQVVRKNFEEFYLTINNFSLKTMTA